MGVDRTTLGKWERGESTPQLTQRERYADAIGVSMRELVRNGDLTIDVVQPESVLHLRMGDNSVMAEQMTAMADLADLPNVTIRITPFDAGMYEALRMGDFTIMAHPWGGAEWVHFERNGSGQFVTDVA